MPALWCACTAPAMAQQPVLQPSMGLQAPLHVDRRIGLREDIRRVQAERTSEPAQVLKAPAAVVVPMAAPATTPRQLTQGQHEELRQQLRQQQIENLRQRP